MELFIEIIKFFVYSIIIVLISKYILVKLLRRIAETLKLKSKVVGGIAGIATSIPELLTVSFSAFSGLIATSTYNIISSNIINLVQYLSSIVLNKNQKALKNTAIKIDLGLVIATIIIPIIIAGINIENSMVIVPVFAILFLLFYKISNNAHKVYMKKEQNENEEEEQRRFKINKRDIMSAMSQGIALICVGIILYFIGNLLSDVLENLSIKFNISELLIGILLGVITSLPELITFIEAQRHHTDEKEGVVEATSNLLTSNVMNLFIIQSIGIIIYLIYK